MAKQTLPVGSSRTRVEFSNGTVVRVAPFVGQATQWINERGARVYRVPAEDDTGLDLRDALEQNGIAEQETIELDVTGPAVRAPYTARPQNDRIVIEPAAPASGAVQVVLYQDESGGVSWHFPDGFREQPRRAGPAGWRAPGRGAATFTIPARTVEAQRAFGHAGTRGLLTKWGRKILKVLVIPLVSPLLADPVDAIVGAIERRCRRDLVRGLTPDNYTRRVTDEFADWERLAAGPALLVVHGILSTTDGMLSLLPRAAMDRLAAHYEGRVIAFDHLTVSRDPEANARFLLERLAAASNGRPLRFDVLCHSRGGIVARTLVERGASLVPNHPCRFEKVFFVATPNQGSPLADPRHTVDMIDVFTNLLTNFDDGPAMYAIETILAMVKLLAYTAEKELPGVAAMGTEGYIRDVLNRPGSRSGCEYAAAAANYEPDPARDNAFFTGRFCNWVMDRVFTDHGARIANDLVVPSDGVFEANGAPSFPIADPLRYDASDHVWHTGFFRQPRTLERIYRHFGIGAPELMLTGAPTSAEPAEEEARADVDLFEPALEDALDVETEALPEESAGAMPESEGGGIDLDVGIPDTESAGAGGTRSGGSERFGFRYISTPMPTSARLPRAPRTTESIHIPRMPSVRLPSSPPPREAVPAAPTPAMPPMVVERAPHLDFHEQVEEGVANDLVVSLADLGEQATDDRLADHVTIDLMGESSVDLDVVVNAAGFDVVPPHATITVGRVHDAKERATFTLTARTPGREPVKRVIHADFWLRNSCIGSVSHYTYVIPKDYAGPRPSAGEQRAEPFAIAAAPRESCDWVVYLLGESSPYQLFVSSNIRGDVYQMKAFGALNVPGGQLSDLFNAVLQSQFDAFPLAAGMSEAAFAKAVAGWQDGFAREIDAFGKRLWTYLPQSFRDAYFALYDRQSAPRSIQVHSTDMTFPWEIVVPFRAGHPGERLKPLGLAHVIGRWKPGLAIKPPASQLLRVERFCLVHPKYPPPDDLPFAAAEAAELAKLFKGITPVVPAKRSTVTADVLDRTDIHVLHFTGHGTFAPPNADLSALMLEDTLLDALALTGTPLCLDAQPIVYLNACSVGAVGLSVGRPAGFAAALLEGDGQHGGCTGVIAPYWPVNDARAKDFSVSFYRKLSMRRSIGEALQELRAEHPSDPTYSAYAYFGDPWVRCSFVV